MADMEIPKDKTGFRYFILEVSGTLTALLEEKDPFLRQHSERVANNCANFCDEFKLFDEDGIETIYFAGLLHDIGVVGVPSGILQKVEPFADEEMILVKKTPSGQKKSSQTSAT